MGTMTINPYVSNEVRHKEDKKLGRVVANDIWDILRMHILN